MIYYNEISDYDAAHEQLLSLLESNHEPRALFSMHLSSVFMDAEEDMTIVEMIRYMMYHALIRMYHVSVDGKYCVDTLQLDMLVVALRKIMGTLVYNLQA